MAGRLTTWMSLRRAAVLAAVLAACLAAFAIPPARAGLVAVDGEAAAQARWQELQNAVDVLKSAQSLATLNASSQGRRLALVIGNDDYTNLEKLRKAASDSRAIADALVDLGFEVTALQNVGRNQFDDALDTFYDKLGDGDIAFFFYAGHGVQAGSVNYLLPTDTPSVEAGGNPRLERNAIDATRIVAEMTGRGARLSFVALDACRDDPFPQADQRGARQIGGLVRMEPEQGAFIIYSAGTGQTALDSLAPTDTDPNSVFTRKFRPILETPGMPIVEIAKRTQVEVKALADKVNHAQAPAYYDQVVGQFYFRKPEPKLYGLVVGIDEYARVQRLRGAANDARLVGEALRKAGASEVVEAIDRDARPTFIDYAWRSLMDKASPGDTIVFAYAGASFRAPGPGSASEPDGLDEYLALADTDWDVINAQRAVPDDGNSLSDNTITDWMEKAAQKNLNVVFLVDGCHGGGLLDRDFANISFIGASAEDEVVGEYEIDGQYHGAMSVAFADAVSGGADLNGDGFVTQRELFAKTRADLFAMVRFRQSPQYLPTVDEAEPSLALFKVPAAGPTTALSSR